MASFTLFGGSNTARTLVNGDTGYISQNGALATTGDAISATTTTLATYVSIDVTVLGSLYSSGGNAIDFRGNSLDLFVGTNGSIGSSMVDGVRSNFTASVFISNDGYIFGGDDALDLRVTDDGAYITILNTGTISGKSDAIVTGSGTGTTRITNNGEISGGTGGIDQMSGDAIIINYGNISGSSYGYDGSSATDTIRNFGTLNGGVIVREGDDSVTNRGTIDFVTLGDGADVFDGRGGIVTRDVAGGLGDDVYTISQSDIVLIEDATLDIDLVRSTVNFTLSDNIENLTLIGNNATRATGNAEANILTGNNENNVLRGLSGGDTLNGRAGNDILRGGRSNDKLFGGTGDDVLRGGAGKDTLNGGDGDDRLIGGLGRDKLTGGDGNDVFVFSRLAQSPNSSDRNTITDFELDIDRIDLSRLAAGTVEFIGTGPFTGTGAQVKVSVNGANSNLFVDVDGDGVADMKIVLTGVTGITESDFIL